MVPKSPHPDIFGKGLIGETITSKTLVILEHPIAVGRRGIQQSGGAGVSAAKDAQPVDLLAWHLVWQSCLLIKTSRDTDFVARVDCVSCWPSCFGRLSRFASGPPGAVGNACVGARSVLSASR